MTDLSFLLAPSLAFVAAVGAPGPATLAVTAVAITRGRPEALVFAAGLSLGLTIWGVVAAFGLGAAILSWAPALVVFRLAGGAFLLWLAWCAARRALAPAPIDPADAPTGAPADVLRRGVLLNMVNPKAILAWAVFIAFGLPEVAGPSGFAAIVAVFSVVGAAIYTSYAFAFSHASVRAGYARCRRGVDGAFAVLFGLVAVRLLTWRPEAI